MANTIVTKNSSTASAVPVSGDLTQGELAVNVTDKRLFTKNSGGTVVELGTNPASLALPNGTTNGVAYLNGSKVLTTGSALTFDGTNLGLDAGGGAGPAYLNISQRSRFGYDGTNVLISDAGTGKDIVFTRITEQMRLTSTGLGIGTSSPASKLDVSSSSFYVASFIRSASGASSGGIRLGNSSRVFDLYADSTGFAIEDETAGATRLKVDTSGNLGLGVTPSTWSTGKAFEIGHAGNAIFDVASSQLTITQNAYYNGGYKYGASTTASRYDQGGGSHIWYNAPSGTAGNAITFTQAMTLDASGNLLVGTTSSLATATNKLQILVSNSVGDSGIVIKHTDATGATAVYAQKFLNSSGTEVGSIKVTSTATSYNTSSDYRLKNTVAPMTGALAKVAALKPVTYKWNADGSDGQGFIAHELQEVVPDAVTGLKDNVDAEGNPIYQGIDTSFLVATLTAAIQEQQAIIETLTARITALEGQ